MGDVFVALVEPEVPASSWTDAGSSLIRGTSGASADVVLVRDSELLASAAD